MCFPNHCYCSTEVQGPQWICISHPDYLHSCVYPAICFVSFMLTYLFYTSVSVMYLYHNHAIRQILNCWGFVFVCFKLSARKKGLIFVPAQLAKIIVLYCELQKVRAGRKGSKSISPLLNSQRLILWDHCESLQNSMWKTGTPLEHV